MKNIFSFLILFFSINAGFAQFIIPVQPEHYDFISRVKVPRCGTDWHTQSLTNTNPQYAAARNDYETAINEWISRNAHSGVQSTLTIPVVVHVIWKTAAQNIGDPQVISQIDVLNEDYGRYNADTTNTPAGFQAVAANTGIQFCLAQVDPQGNPTTGIEHIQTTATSFSTNDNVKHSATAGANAWDPTRYLNIWVCNLSNGLLGYAEFPTASVSQTFGVVIQYNAFGRIGTLQAPFNNGRTCTHEIAHCFNLFHIAPSASCVDNDQCADTPVPHDQLITSCPTYPLLDACNTVAPGVMFMNFMANAPDDNCMNVFTLNQAARMNAVLNIAPYNALVTSTACMPLGINSQASSSESISVFPNPTSGIFSVSFSSTSVSKIRIYDMLGNLVQEFSRDEMKNESVEIDLSEKADGVYFLQVITGENKLISRKIILTR
jgi:hypothetical protein